MLTDSPQIKRCETLEKTVDNTVKNIVQRCTMIRFALDATMTWCDRVPWIAPRSGAACYALWNSISWCKVTPCHGSKQCDAISWFNVAHTFSQRIFIFWRCCKLRPPYTSPKRNSNFYMPLMTQSEILHYGVHTLQNVHIVYFQLS